MDHQTITRNADGSLAPIDCACGEDHGPSLHEELMIMRASNRRQAAKVDALRMDLGRVLAHLHATAGTAKARDARRLARKVSAELVLIARDLTVLS